MSVGLSAEDLEFLRSLASDRAESVRMLAQRLAARIAGSSEFDERMRAAHERLELKSIGIIGRRKVLMPKLPKGLAEPKIDAWLIDSFTGVSTTLLAERLQLTRETFVEALADERLRSLFFANAVVLGERETAFAIAASLEFAEARRILAASRDTLAALAPEQRRGFWDAFAAALESGSLEERCAFAAELYEILRMPPPSSLMEPAPTAEVWQHWLEATKNAPETAQAEIPELLVALTDRPRRVAWRERLNDLPPAIASTALALADFFDALDLQSTQTN